ncbi:MAG: molybdate ABC transporter permease subunit [Gammaproteobacteria bacterium]|nr:molybdate ABC transporter permease subunit [Gammaproteobacteria bacterium]
MDWAAFHLSIELALWTIALLLPVGILLARALAWRRFAARSILEALVALPLVLPPTVLGFYLLVAFAGQAPLGRLWTAVFGSPAVFSFEGLVMASVIFNLPFMIQPLQRAFEAVPNDMREAAWCCGMSRWRTFWRVELPLAWMGVITAVVITFAHTLGEFGVVLMVGGNIPGETRTLSIAIYDRVQAFDNRAAGVMAAALLAFAFFAITALHLFNDLIERRRRG